jgi:hypothetical protein
MKYKYVSESVLECPEFVRKSADGFMFSFSAPINRQSEFLNREQTKMEIGPVTAVRIAPSVRPREADLGLTDVYEVERSTRIGDETYIPNAAKAASGFEEDEDEFDELADELEAESRPRLVKSSKISRFA